MESKTELWKVEEERRTEDSGGGLGGGNESKRMRESEGEGSLKEGLLDRR